MINQITINRSLLLHIIKVVCKVLMNCWSIVLCLFCIIILVYWTVGALFTTIVVVLLILVVLYNLQDHLLYHPDLPPSSRLFVSLPSIFNLPYESVYTRTNDGVLVHLLIIQQKENVANVPTILYLHGNAGNVGHRLQNVVELYQKLQCNIVMVEYRGYGLSQGRPCEQGLYLDAIAAFDFVASRKDLNHGEIILYGRSLGGAVAIEIATRSIYSDKMWVLVVENTFTSIQDMAVVLIAWRILTKIPLLFYKNKFLSKAKVGKLQVPTLFISGSADTLVPPRMMEELHALCSSSHKQLVQFPNGTHNETWRCRGYYTALSSFLSEVRIRKSQPQHFS